MSESIGGGNHGAALRRDGKSLVIGASGIVGSHIVKRLFLEGRSPIGLSRNEQQEARAKWIKGDLADPQSISWPAVEVIYCTASARLLADALPTMATPSLKRVVLFTTTSISTKAYSTDPEVQAGIAAYASAERDVIVCCENLGVTWTILRPTMIYDEGKDQNLTRLAVPIVNPIRWQLIENRAMLLLDV
jgi:nucleoside-diphosphate-sugar epimerase